MENNLDSSSKLTNFAAEKEQMIQLLLNAIAKHYGSASEFEQQHKLPKRNTRRTIETMLGKIHNWNTVFEGVFKIEITCNQQQQQQTTLSPPPKSDED